MMLVMTLVFGNQILHWLYQTSVMDGGRSVQTKPCIWGKEYRDVLSGHWSATRSMYHQTPDRYVLQDVTGADEVCSLLPTVLSFIAKFCNVLNFCTYIVICS